MGTYREYIEKLKNEWVGQTVIYENEKYNVVDVDYNGFLLIDKKSKVYRYNSSIRFKYYKAIKLLFDWRLKR